MGGLLPIIASRLQKVGQQNNLGPPRLVCRQWAAELPQGCTTLRVTGKGPPAGWEQRFCGLEELTWLNQWVTPRLNPDNEGQTLPKLRSLHLMHCSNSDLQMLRGLSALTSLNLGCRWITDEALKELGHLSTLTSLSLKDTAGQITNAGLNEPQAHVGPHLPQPDRDA